jgi:hypothetical protein
LEKKGLGTVRGDHLLLCDVKFPRVGRSGAEERAERKERPKKVYRMDQLEGEKRSNGDPCKKGGIDLIHAAAPVTDPVKEFVEKFLTGAFSVVAEG